MKQIRLSILAAAAALCFVPAIADEPVPPRIVVPLPDAERGREVFAAKGCVVCHEVNGIGGKAGPALDGEGYDGEIDPLDFAARMWRGARAMSMLQSLNFGYQIDVTAGDIADLAAFVASDEARGQFAEEHVPEAFRGWTIDATVGALGAVGAGTPEEERQLSITRGYILAERWCAECHAVLREGEYGVAGPAFAEIAARPDLTKESIRAWLSEPHKGMPEILGLRDIDLDDVAEYILSMKR